MERARIILNDGQEYDAIVREFTVECGPCESANVTFEGVLTGHKPRNLGPEATKVIFNDPATVVLWSDGTKTVVKCSENDTFDPEIGLAMAICKKAFGNTGAYNDVFRRWVPGYDIDMMRDKLSKYCSGKRCSECPLNIPVSRCGCGAFFTISKGEDGYMTDDEIADAYRQVFGK